MKWNVQPKIKDVFFEDFSQGIKSDIWNIPDQKWGKYNNGVSAENAFFSRDSAVCRAFGAESGGIAVLASRGDFYQPDGTSSKSRQGSCIVSKRTFGPGKYEVRLKVVPRLGQCTAIWTYYDGGGGEDFKDYLQNKYSEIDIETPLWADFRNILGVSYQYYHENWDWKTQVALRRDSVFFDKKQLRPYNDGKWHIFSFEWRNDKANGDRGIVWYLDGKEFGSAANWIPEYKAAFWVGNWFPDDPAWIGDPLFENAYMYVDWIRITEYDDPALEVKHTGGGGTAADLGSAPIPVNNYISNGRFTQSLTLKNTKGQDITSWETVNAERAGNSLSLDSEGRAAQIISAQYGGYSFRLSTDAQITGGNGKCLAYAEYLSGNTLAVKGRSAPIQFSSIEREHKDLIFTVDNDDSIENIRIVLETEAGTTASVYEVGLYLI